MILATALLSSCKGDYTDWANPQTNAQEEAKNVTFTIAPTASLDLNTYTEETVKMFTPTFGGSETLTPVGYEVELAEVADDGAPVTDATIEATEEGLAQTADIKEVIEEIYGKYPTERTVKMIAKAILKNEAGEAFYKVSNEVDYKVMPINYGTAYKLTVNGEVVADLSTDEATYPNFSVSYKGTADDEWAIVDANGDPVADGTFAKAGTYLFDFNAESGFANVEKAPSILYLAGDCNGWNHIDYLVGNDQDIYTGYMYLNQNGFKFCTEPNWNGTNYGEGFSTDDAAADIKMTEEAGYYKVEVNLTTKSYTLTPITTIGIIGSATAAGWDADQDMTYNQAERCWEIKDIVLTDGALKFRANDAWGINWGGATDALVQDGSDISVAAGTYDIKLYAWANGYAKCELIKK